MDNDYPDKDIDRQRVRIARPTRAQWQKFIEFMNTLPEWEKDYQGVACDGTSWELYYQHQDITIISGGYMQWPEHYDRFLVGLKELTGFKRGAF